LALGAQLECSQADIWQRKNSSRARRLGLPVPDLMARSLELPLDVYLGRVEGDVWPGKPERIAPSQSQDENQHVGGVQRIPVAAGGLQEGAGFFD
jgi:hypothetical protein